MATVLTPTPQHKHTGSCRPGSSCVCDDCQVKPSIFYTAYPIGRDWVSCKSTGAHFALARPNKASEITTSDKEMSASCILASSRRDRQGDIIECSGVELADHVINPVVLWDHGKQHPLPIGVTEDFEARYTVRYHPDEDILTQTTYFAPDPFSRQVYLLVRRKFIRANSIAVKDVQVEPLPPDEARGFPVRRTEAGRVVPYKRILKSILAEVTWTPLPANPDAVASLLDHPVIDGDGFANEKLHPLILKSFMPFAPPRKAWTNGFTEKSAIAPRTPEAIVPDTAKAITTDDQYQDESEMLSDRYPGHIKALDMHEGYAALHDHLRGGPKQDHPQLNETLARHLDSIEDMAAEIRDFCAEHYPDEEQPMPFDEEASDMPTEEDETDEDMTDKDMEDETEKSERLEAPEGNEVQTDLNKKSRTRRSVPAEVPHDKADLERKSRTQRSGISGLTRRSGDPVADREWRRLERLKQQNDQLETALLDHILE